MGPLGDVVIHRHCRVVSEQRQPRPVLVHAHKHLGRRLAQRSLAQRLAAPLGHVEQGLSQRTVVLVEVGTALGLCEAKSNEPIQLRDGIDPRQKPRPASADGRCQVRGNLNAGAPVTTHDKFGRVKTSSCIHLGAFETCRRYTDWDEIGAIFLTCEKFDSECNKFIGCTFIVRICEPFCVQKPISFFGKRIDFDKQFRHDRSIIFVLIPQLRICGGKNFAKNREWLSIYHNLRKPLILKAFPVKYNMYALTHSRADFFE